MLILGINGSSQQEGNSANLLDLGLEEAGKMGAETRMIYVQKVLEEMERPYCTVCEPQCPGECYKGRQLGEVFQLMERCDGILLASPVYFGTVTAQLKGFWDMSRKLRKKKALLNTVGGAIAVGGARFGGQETTIRALQDMMLIQGMMVVGDGHHTADSGHQGACAQKPALEDEFGLSRVKILARRIVEVASVTGSLRNPGS